MSPNILVVGDLMMDHYLCGSCGRISPEAPVPVVDVSSEKVVPGGAGNVLRNLLALGARVSAASVVGDDATGHEIEAALDKQGVDCRAVLTQAGRQTSRKTRILAGGQQVVRFDTESRSAISDSVQDQLIDVIQYELDAPQAVLLSDYDKGVLTEPLTQAVIGWARKQCLPVLVDPKGHDYHKYRGATVITPNKKEAAELCGIRIDSDESLERAGEQLKRSLDVPYVMITLSEGGMAIFGESMHRIRAVAQEVYDVTGAGDTVLATLGYGLACGLNIHEAADLANSAAAVVVGKLGSATATLDEITAHRRELAGRAPAVDQGVAAAEQVEAVAERLRLQGKSIVFTNGCFDLLHRGHVEYLKASRQCGDALIVGINSDESIRRIKGPQRPVVSQQDRAHILAALSCVDLVTIFEEDTPYQLIQRIRPDVLTKGADYAGQPIVGSDLVPQVRLISYVEGHSTSVTIDRIKTAA